MANRDIFSKHIPNVKLTTRFDADGNEIQVERREDADAAAKELETFDILVAAGYYRAKIKGISPFDKVVGGMTWCIECCDYDVNVDFLFHENLTIGQKISLVEKIVSVLPKMKCPFLIEPHQIQGLEFLSIHPVIQWLVKKSVENRAERSEKLKKFAIGQFHNNYQYKTDKENLEMMRNASAHIKRIQEMYSPCRQYKRKEAGNEDEKTRVYITLLEYGNKAAVSGAAGVSTSQLQKSEDSPSSEAELIDSDAIIEREIDVDKLLKNLYVAKEDDSIPGKAKLLDEDEKQSLQKHYLELKQEMEADTKELSEQSQIRSLEATMAALEKKMLQVKAENLEFEMELKKLQEKLEEQKQIEMAIQDEIKEFEKIEAKSDKNVVENIQSLVKENEDLKREEAEFKEHCRQELARMQKEIKEMEESKQENSIAESEALLVKERERLQELRLVLAKKNRGIVAIQRQLDNVPDRTELAQYQRRFLELYNQISAKHSETKQFYTMYNTLDDTKLYMEKEISLLNSICENYNEGMTNAHSREQFIKQFEAIVDGVIQTETKLRQKYNDAKEERDTLNAQLMFLIDQERKYAAAVKQLKRECQRCDALMAHLKSIEESPDARAPQ